MLAFPIMLIAAAANAGMSIPEDIEDYDPNKFPHWWVFTKMQLGASMPYPGCHFANAKVVAEIPVTEIKSVTPRTLVLNGFAYGRQIP